MVPDNVMNIFAPLLLLLTIVFVLVWPPVLMTLIGILRKEKQRSAASLAIGLVAVAFGTIGATHAGSQFSLMITGIILLSIATVSASAVATAIFLSRNLIMNGRKVCVAVGSLIQLPFLFALIVNPDVRPGDPLPLVPDRLPILGSFFDALAKTIGTAGETGYEIFFSFGLLIGLYLEVFFGVVVFCLIASILLRKMRGEGQATESENSGKRPSDH